MSLGEMMRPVEIDNMPGIVCPWSPSITFDGILTSSWKGEDGTAAVVFINITEDAQTVQWHTTRENLGLFGQSFKASLIYPEGAFTPHNIDLKKNVLTDEVSIQPRSVTIIKIRSGNF